MDKDLKTTKEEDPSLSLTANPIKYATGVPGVTTTEPHDKAYLESVLKHGKHSDLVKRILRKRLEQRAAEYPRWPASQFGNVRVMYLEGPFSYDRDRLGPNFTEEERLYRVKYLKSLELHHDEPLHVPEYEIELLNPLRRFYMKPMDWVENNIIRKYFKSHPVESALIRSHIAKSFMIWLGLCGIWYNFKYCHYNWETYAGTKIVVEAPKIYPGDPRFPFKDWRTSADHADFGFSKRKVFLDLDKIELTPN